MSITQVYARHTPPGGTPSPRGERWLIVFTRDGDIWGAFLDRETKTLAPFPISTSGRLETQARVIPLEPGRFLVAYMSDFGSDHRFAGRIVLTEPPPGKRRATR